MRFLVPLLLISLLLPACKVGVVRRDDLTPAASQEPTRTPTPTETPLPATDAATPTATTTPTHTAAPTHTPSATSTTRPIPSATSPPAPTPTPATPVVTIQTFTVDVEDLAVGKRLTFNWETVGARDVNIIGGTAHRFPPWWEVPPSGGTLTVELERTLYRDPSMTLQATDAHGHSVTQSVEIPWPCRHQYFFAAGPDICPQSEATFTAAAEQPFQNGRMIWLAQMPYDESVIENQIFVLYDDGSGERFDDTWTPDQPESDPALVPPAGLYQPVRGFGKLWRESASVRERLGWALAPEEGFEGALQMQVTENIPDVAYIRALDGKIIRLIGLVYLAPRGGSGRWEFVTP